MKEEEKALRKKTKKTISPFNNNKGQMVVEIVLILSIFVSSIYFLSRQFNNIEPFDAFVTGPWKTVAGMIESGTWKKKQLARGDHPNHFRRMYSNRGDSP